MCHFMNHFVLNWISLVPRKRFIERYSPKGSIHDYFRVEINLKRTIIFPETIFEYYHRIKTILLYFLLYLILYIKFDQNVFILIMIIYPKKSI